MKVRKISLKYFNPAEAARQGLDEPGWWMYDPNSPDVKWVGPYGTKAEANDDRIGLERFWKNVCSEERNPGEVALECRTSSRG